MRKKGMFGITDIYAIVLIVLTLIVFFVLFNLPGFSSENYVIESTKTSTGTFLLLNYLKTPIDDGNMADLIIKYANNNSYYDKFKEETKKILAYHFPEKYCLRGNIELKIIPDNKRLKGITTKVKRIGFGIEADYKTSVNLPLLEPEKYVEVTLSAKC